MTLRQTATLSFALPALVLAWAPAELAAAKPPATPPPACFYARQADSFAAQGEQTVNVRVGVSRYYRLDLFAPCLDIDFAQTIAMRSRVGDWICEGKTNDVEILTRSAAGPQRCLVTNVTPLSPADVAALPRRAKP